jgi:nitrogen fixation/metabolism regulation signal transduction histidine kinase
MKHSNYERRIALMALAAGLPAVLVCLLLLWLGDYTPKVIWTVALLVVCAWLGYVLAVHERVIRPLQTLANLLSALREGDYSIRARGARGEDALAEVAREVNALGETLREQRLGALEATALLRRVMEEIDVAIFAFDDGQRLRVINRAGVRLLGRPAERLHGATANDLGLGDCLEGDPARTVQINFPGGVGRWGLRRSTFRAGGLPHQLVVLSDLSRVLREEERAAWQRLIRVLGHELNNSLAPIRSVADSLNALLRRQPRPADWEEDARSGLAVIAARAESLNRFMNAYARLARLPAPCPGPVNVAEWVRRGAGLETRLSVHVRAGPELSIRGDGDQLEQLLINLVRNAADAALETGGAVQVSWAKNGAYLEVRVEDEGPGLPSSANLFVPFFTTKPNGSGIGLVLSRQIAEAHGGSLTLENRSGHRGCMARLRLPL